MKKLIKILPVVMVVCMVLTSVFADNPNGGGTGILLPSQDAIGGGTDSIDTFDDAANRVWNTVINVVRILAIAAVVFAGLRYMFASADQKADIKKSMGILAVGAILVFGASFVLDLLMSVTSEVVGQ